MLRAPSRAARRINRADKGRPVSNRNRAIRRSLMANKPAREPRAANHRKMVRSPTAPDPMRTRARNRTAGSQQNGEQQAKPGDEQVARVVGRRQRCGGVRSHSEAFGGEWGVEAGGREVAGRRTRSQRRERSSESKDKETRRQGDKETPRVASPLQRTGNRATKPKDADKRQAAGQGNTKDRGEGAGAETRGDDLKQRSEKPRMAIRSSKKNRPAASRLRRRVEPAPAMNRRARARRIRSRG